MAPKKRQNEAEAEADAEAPKPAPVRRSTRSSTRLGNGKPAVATQPELPKKKKAKATAAKEKEETGDSKEVEKAKIEEVEEKPKSETENGVDAPDKQRTIVVEYCKQCSRFKTRAFKVRDGLEHGAPGVVVKLNPEKPRRGCFEIREEDGETFISLLDLKRPFKPMTDLDMDEVIAEIINKIK